MEGLRPIDNKEAVRPLNTPEVAGVNPAQMEAERVIADMFDKFFDQEKIAQMIVHKKEVERSSERN